MGADRFVSLVYRTSLVGCLLGVAGTLYFLGGLAGYLANPAVNVAVGVALILAALFFIYHFVASAAESRAAFFLWLLILSILAAEVLLGLVPPTARDELTHHLVIPRLYIRAGRIIEIPFAPYSYYPMLLDMLYTPWVRWGWDSIPKLIHGLFGFLTGLLLYAYLARRMSPVYGMLGFFFFISTPIVLRLTNWAYVDLGVAFYSTASLLCLLLWAEAKQDRHWLVVAGLSAGFAAASKPNGLLALVLLSLLLALTLARHPQRGAGGVIPALALFGVAAAAPFLPWLVKNGLQTGNPFFPLLGGLFGSGSEGAAATSAGGGELGIFAKRHLLYGESWWRIAALPLRIFFFGKDDNPQYFDGALSPVLILFLPWAFKGKWLEEKKLLAGFALLYALYALFLADLRARYLLPIVPPLAALLAYGVHNVYLRIVRPSLLIGALLFFAALNGSYLWGYFQSTAPLGYLTGRETRDAYLARMLPEYPVYRYVNRELPARAKIYLLFAGRRAYYCERDYFHDGGELPRFLMQAIRSAWGGEEVEAGLESRGLTHLLVREDLLERFLSRNLTSKERPVWDAFVARHLRLLFQAQGYSVYQLHG